MKTEKEIKKRLRLAEESRDTCRKVDGSCDESLWRGRIEALEWVLE